MEFKNYLIKQLNENILFDPSQWPKRELLGRIVAVAIISVFLYKRFMHFEVYPGSLNKLIYFFQRFNSGEQAIFYTDVQIRFIWYLRLSIWIIDISVFFGYILAYLSRAKAVSVAKGFMEVVYPVFIAGFPLLISFTSNTMISYTSPYYIPAHLFLLSVMFIGYAIYLIGLLTLRKAFTIMPEARELITKGIFKYIRHPLYFGHFIFFIGVTFSHFHWYTVVMCIVFIIGQYYRAKIEEKKLSKAFDDYAVYKKKTGMFFPKLFTR
jgi:protein-S-isoprenylcysteine O-methyltransferase Ste14